MDSAKKIRRLLLIPCVFFSVTIVAQEKPAADAQDIAVKLNNPVANLISVPFQSNIDYGIGQHNGSNTRSIFNRSFRLPLVQS
jgi:hypothetical protein